MGGFESFAISLAYLDGGLNKCIDCVFSARVLCVDWVVQAVGIGVDAAFEERALVVWADESHQAWDEYSVPVSECVTVQRRNVKFTIEPHCSGRLRVGVSKPIGCVVCWLACCWGRGCSCGAMLVTGLAFQTGCNGRIVFFTGCRSFMR